MPAVRSGQAYRGWFGDMGLVGRGRNRNRSFRGFRHRRDKLPENGGDHERNRPILAGCPVASLDVMKKHGSDMECRCGPEMVACEQRH